MAGNVRVMGNGRMKDRGRVAEKITRTPEGWREVSVIDTEGDVCVKGCTTSGKHLT